MHSDPCQPQLQRPAEHLGHIHPFENPLTSQLHRKLSYPAHPSHKAEKVQIQLSACKNDRTELSVNLSSSQNDQSRNINCADNLSKQVKIQMSLNENSKLRQKRRYLFQTEQHTGPETPCLFDHHVHSLAQRAMRRRDRSHEAEAFTRRKEETLLSVSMQTVLKQHLRQSISTPESHKGCSRIEFPEFSKAWT